MTSESDPPRANGTLEVRDLKPSEWYRLRNPLRVAITYVLFELCRKLPVEMKAPVYRDAGVDIGVGSVVSPDVVVDPFFPEKISIGEDSIVGWGTKLLTHEGYADEWRLGSLDIGDDVTLGHSCSTRPGVTIGDGATVAAHSFVNRDVEPGETVGGVPIQTLETDD